MIALRSVAAGLSVAVLAAGPSSAAADQPRVVTGQHGEFHGLRVKPASINFGFDHTAVLGGPDGRGLREPGTLQWTHYTRKEGTAIGTVWLRRHESAYATVRVSRPRGGVFTRMRVRYKEPDGTRTDSRVKVAKGPDGWYFDLILD